MICAIFVARDIGLIFFVVVMTTRFSFRGKTEYGKITL